MYVQLLLNDHDPDIDMWCWGGEPILRNGHYCGQTTTTGYGYTFKKPVCLGFVKNIAGDGTEQSVTNEYILSGDYEVEIAGIRLVCLLSLGIFASVRMKMQHKKIAIRYNSEYHHDQ